MSRTFRRWWALRRRPRLDAAPPHDSAAEPDLDAQLTFAVRLLKEARTRGHHNEAERLRAWIDRCLDERLRHRGR